jgi:hypothetical protein
VRSDRRSRRRVCALHGLTAGFAALALAGCSTTSDAASATVQAATTLATSATDAVTSMVGLDSKTGPALQRSQMEQQAGTAKFKNTQFVAGRTQLQTTRSEFGSRRDQLVSSPFIAARDKFRGQHATPSSGPVLGPAVGDSAAALAILAAAQAGVPVAASNPILARLLPGFGY